MSRLEVREQVNRAVVKHLQKKYPLNPKAEKQPFITVLDNEVQLNWIPTEEGLELGLFEEVDNGNGHIGLIRCYDPFTYHEL